MTVLYILFGTYVAFGVLILLIGVAVKIHGFIFLTKKQRAERKIMVAEQVRIMREREESRKRREWIISAKQQTKFTEEATTAGTLAATSAGAAVAVGII